MLQQGTESALARGGSAQPPWYLPEATQRAGVGQQAAHIQHRNGIYVSHPSISESQTWDLLRGGNYQVFTTDIPQAHPSLLPNLKTLLAATFLQTAAVNHSSYCTELADFQKKKEELP